MHMWWSKATKINGNATSTLAKAAYQDRVSASNLLKWNLTTSVFVLGLEIMHLVSPSLTAVEGTNDFTAKL